MSGRRTYLGLTALVVLAWLAILPLRPLFNPDEGRYAEIPREMLSGGDWIIPHLNGLAYIEKPPLQYWATATALAVFGQNEFGARIYTALAALATLVVVWTTAAALWGEAAAWRSAAVLAGMLLFLVMGQLLTLDMSLTFYMTLAVGGFLRAQSAAPAGATGAAARRWMSVAWGAVGLGVLTKGLVAAAIPAAVFILYTLYTHDRAVWRRLEAARGLPLFLLITVPWHWLAARRLPGFLEFFFVHEHISRYLTPSADREEAWWFFIAVFVLGSIPWTLSALRVLCLDWRRQAVPGRFDAGVFLWIWIVFVGLFFSLSDSKLAPYLLPAMPALALLIGRSATALWRRDLVLIGLFTLVAAIAAAAVSVYGPHFMPATERGRYFALLAGPLGGIAALLAVCGLFVLSRRRRDPTRNAVILGVGWCLSGLLLMRAAAVVAPLYSGVGIARAVGGMPRDLPLFSIGTYDQTLPFYWGRTMELVSYRGELDFGLQRKPDAEIGTVAEFAERWRALPAAYALMESSMFDDLTSQGLPMREVARDVRRVLVTRR